MSKSTRVIALILVGVVASVIYAKNLKIKDLTPAGPGVTENPNGDGMVIMNYKDGPEPRSEIKVTINDFLPNTTYGVQVDPGITDPLAITTNPAGNGHWNSPTLFVDISQENPTVRIFRWDGATSSIGEVSFNELRAIGCVSGNCPMGDPCTVDADCDDGALCTVDTCNGGSCFHALEQCDDGNACTADFCRISDGGCDHDALPNCTP